MKSPILRYLLIGGEMCDVLFVVITEVFVHVESIYSVIH